MRIRSVYGVGFAFEPPASDRKSTQGSGRAECLHVDRSVRTNIGRMDFPSPDTSEYAALMDFMATGGRDRSSLKPGQDPRPAVRHALQRRARAMTQALVVMARVRARRLR